MKQISSPEKSGMCTQNGAHLLQSVQAGDAPGSDCDPLKVCPPSSGDKDSSSGHRKVAVYGLGQSLKTEPRMQIARTAAQQYVLDEVARWTNRGQAIQFTRNRTFPRHGASAVMSAEMTAFIVEQSLAGKTSGEDLLTAAWKPRTKGAKHAQDQKPNAPASANQLESAA